MRARAVWPTPCCLTPTTPRLSRTSPIYRLSGDLFTRSLYCIFRADGGVKTRSDRSFPLSHKGNMGKESPFSARTSIDKRAATQVSPQFAPVDKDEAKRPRKKAKGKRTSEAPAAGGRWSKEEDERLRQGVSSSGPKNWKHISELWMGGKRTELGELWHVSLQKLSLGW